MSYISLYRKYRPETFDGIIGQEHIVRTLKNQIKSGNIGHAYLFTGTRGTGKTSAAKIFARAVNCIDSRDGSPCGICKVCKELSMSNNMDIMEIDAASNNGVDEIRDIRDKVKYPPVNGKYKVYIVDEVHMLTAGAFNALLKTLEEPPQHIIFILATTEVHKLPQTILSRCMRFDFRLVSTELITKLIIDIYSDVHKLYEEEAVRAIAAAGEGSVRDALSIADMCMSYRDGILTYKDVQDVIGASSPELLLEICDGILGTKLEQIFTLINNCSEMGKNFTILSRDISTALRNLLYIKNSDNALKLLKLPQDVYNLMKTVADRYDTVRILTALESLCKLEGTMRYSVQPRIAFEAALIRASILGNELNNDAIARIKVLEDEFKGILNGDVYVKTADAPKAKEIVKEQIKETVKEQIIDKPVVKITEEIITEKVTKTEALVNKEVVKTVETTEKKTEKTDIKDVDISGVDIVEMKPTEEKLVFGNVNRVNKGVDAAKEIIGKVIRELRKKQLFHLHGIFGYNDVKVWIEDGKYYIQTFEDYAFKQLTDAANNKIILDELFIAGDGSFNKLVVLQPKDTGDISKSLDQVKDLFDNEILTIKK